MSDILSGLSPTSSIATPSVTSTASSSTGSATSSQMLGENAFLKLLIAQLQNQDPLNPADSTDFVTQLAQFSAVEQATQQSQTLSQMSTQLNSIAGQSAVSMIGDNVQVQASQLNFNGSLPTQSTFTLGAAAANVSVTITDSNSNTVQTINLGAQRAGPCTVTWNGQSSAGLTEPAGTYNYTVNATTSGGAPVSVSQQLQGTVTNVTYTGGVPYLQLSSGATAPLSGLLSVSPPTSKTGQ
jgi:flagellar basal-body rod modification protein FlgD